MTINYRRIYK